MEDSIIYLPQTRSSGLREILVGAANPRSIFMRSDVHDTMEDGTKCITRLSTRDSFKKIVQRPAFWYVPRSVDVARVLTAAQHAHLSRVKKGLNDAIQAALEGSKTPKEALTEAQAAAERILKPYR